MDGPWWLMAPPPPPPTPPPPLRHVDLDGPSASPQWELGSALPGPHAAPASLPRKPPSPRFLPAPGTHTLRTSFRRSPAGRAVARRDGPCSVPLRLPCRGPDPAPAHASSSRTAERDPEQPGIRWDKRVGVRKGPALDGRPAGSSSALAVGGRARPPQAGGGSARPSGPSPGHSDECSRTPVHPEQLYELCMDRTQPPCGEARGRAPASYMIHLQETNSWLPGLFSPHLNVISMKTFWRAEDNFQWTGL